jgi:hypothetical protein
MDFNIKTLDGSINAAKVIFSTLLLVGKKIKNKKNEKKNKCDTTCLFILQKIFKSCQLIN